ncbi:signal peptidase [Chryseobacterium sp. IHB B 17019]|jgi:hypothetical protein|uniref:hypothetical protein n=1 Tax=Chryseobacterium sp. IHB B 17019 TaxID=1721091 RepID=UPI000720A4EE|nr:hypothetical protein [Chryseobacterium sp. IHB B 17019]ALR31587.1 signal peptidase [Chryseobacterium sp. IHB B 17019]
MKTINKLVSAFFLLAITLIHAQSTPPNPIGGGGGGNGTGAPSSPIDMYVYGLGIIAVMFIAFFTKKYSGKKI